MRGVIWMFALLALTGAVPVLAQSDGSVDACNQAWLSQAWPAVAVQCSTAEEYEADRAIERSAQADTGETVDLPLTRSIASDSWLLSGIYRARSAYAYARLKRRDGARGAVKEALRDLQNAQKFADDPAIHARIENVITLLQNPKFLRLPTAQVSAIDQS